MEPLEDELQPENYVDDLKLWLDKYDDLVDLNYGLVADFGFDRELIVEKKSLNIDGKNPVGGGIVGKKGTTTAYLNRAKGNPDAAILGDKDRQPEIVEGKKGNAIKMLGDCGIRFNRDLDFDRFQPFSVSIWVKLLKEGEKGPIFKNSNSVFEGHRGWKCELNEDGTLLYQLNHVWPDNCIDYRTETKLPLDKWTHLVMTYDGSSKAKGLKLYVGGEISKSKLLKDNLHKSLLYGKDSSNGLSLPFMSLPFMIGIGKERSIENMVMDELKVYNRELSQIEAAKLFGESSTTSEPSEEQKLKNLPPCRKKQKVQ